MLRISEFILNLVLNSAWQVTVIFVIAAFASWLLRNGPARYRHTLWLIALVGSLVQLGSFSCAVREACGAGNCGRSSGN